MGLEQLVAGPFDGVLVVELGRHSCVSFPLAF
jgi:hypothetical protein